MEADSLQLVGDDDVTLAAKRVFGIGDRINLERRARALADAIEAPLQSLDLALANWRASQRMAVGVAPGALDEAVGARARRPRTVAAAGRATDGCRRRARAAMTSTSTPTVPKHGLRYEHQGVLMSLCFIEPHDAIRVIADCVGREARRQLVGEVVRAWVDDIPEQ